jgi:arabinose-5-phosphate isomerase
MPKALSTERRTSARSGDLIASAVRTLEVEATGITILSAAIHDGLGRAFIAAVELISGAQGRLIVTGMGKSGEKSRRHSRPRARRPFSCIPAKQVTAISA